MNSSSAQITANGLKFLPVWFCSAVEKTYVFPISGMPEGENALYEIQAMALTVLSDPNKTFRAMPLYYTAKMFPVLSQLFCVLQLWLY